MQEILQKETKSSSTSASIKTFWDFAHFLGKKFCFVYFHLFLDPKGNFRLVGGWGYSIFTLKSQRKFSKKFSWKIKYLFQLWSVMEKQARVCCLHVQFFWIARIYVFTSCEYEDHSHMNDNIINICKNKKSKLQKPPTKIIFTL